MNSYAHYFMQSVSVGGLHQLPPGVAPFITGIIIIIVAWSIVWKGLALWHAARNHQKGWFIIILIVNTVGILEIVYLLFFRKNRNGNISTTTVTHTTTTVPPIVPPAPPSGGSSTPVV